MWYRAWHVGVPSKAEWLSKLMKVKQCNSQLQTMYAVNGQVQCRVLTKGKQ